MEEWNSACLSSCSWDDRPLVELWIKQSDVQQPDMVSVQVNEEFAEREDWDNIQIKEGDKVMYINNSKISNMLELIS